MQIATAIGLRLRETRMAQGLSLTDVQLLTDGRFKTSAVGAYERGDRVIPSDKLVELARFYEVPTFTLLPYGSL